MSVFERFSERGRQAVVLAQEEAREIRSGHVGTESLLLGVLREQQGLAARLLESLDITVERVRVQVAQHVSSGEGVDSSAPIPFTPRATAVLERAGSEARRLANGYVETEHLLLAMADVNDGVAMRILRDCGVDSGKIRDGVTRMMQDPGRREADPQSDRSSSVFETFTEPAREVCRHALAAARELKHRHLGTEHLLLGLLRERSVAAEVLESLGVTFEAVLAEVLRIVIPDERSGGHQVPFTPNAKKVLELALRESRAVGHQHIGPEHILLGLIDDPGIAGRILSDLSADPTRIRGEVNRTFFDPAARPAAGARRRSAASVLSPTSRARQLMIAAAGHAADDGRSEYDVGDLLLAMTGDEPTASLLAQLGVDEAAVREAIQRQHPLRDPPEASPEP